jgi:hypothetical protein
MRIIQKQGAMVRPCILVMVGVEGLAFFKNGLRPFRIYHVVFKGTSQFLIFVFFLV